MNPPHPDVSSPHRPKKTAPPRPFAERDPEPRQEAPTDLPAPDGIRHVLVVEDDPVFAKLLTEYLKTSNTRRYRSAVARSVQDAVQMLRQNPFDVIIADLGLPDSREYDTIEALTDAAPQVPIVVLTGTAEGGVGPSLEAVRRGASYFLRKGSVDAAAVERGIHYATERKQLRELLDDGAPSPAGS